jgi:hypothetical protein
VVGRLISTVFLIAILAVVVTGCGSNSSADNATATPRTAATPVSATLSGFASLAEPALKGSVGEGSSLVSQMLKVKSSNFGLMANTCTAVGGDLANYWSSFTSDTVPPGIVLSKEQLRDIQAVHRYGRQGFLLALASTDECGQAGDSEKRKMMQTAASDLKRALHLLSYTESIVSRWYKA